MPRSSAENEYIEKLYKSMNPTKKKSKKNKMYKAFTSKNKRINLSTLNANLAALNQYVTQAPPARKRSPKHRKRSPPLSRMLFDDN